MSSSASRSRTLSVVIPVYRSEESLPRLYERLAPVLAELCSDYEVVLVDDDSPGECWKVIEDLARREPRVRGIRLMRNYGQHNAVLCGVREARHEIVVTMDDDLQHPPEEIPKLLEKLDEGFDVVYGTPLHEQHGLWRDLASRVTKRVLTGAMGAETASKVSAFRVFRRHLADAFAGFEGPYVSLDVLLTWATTRFAAIRVRHDPRQFGASNYDVRRLLTHSMNMMTGFSTFPLQLASLIGFGLTLFGVALLIFVLGRFLIQGSVVPGFPFLASIIAIFSGAQLFSLGIIGEYLARMHFRMMEQPTYAVRARTAGDDGPRAP